MRRERARLLIVDDQPEVRKVLLHVFERDGRFAIAEAGDGAEALSLIEVEPPDVVILDISMPTMNGLTVIPQLLELSPASKIIVLSSHSGMEQDVIAMGAHAFLPKTSKPKVLLATVNEALSL